MDSVLHIEPVNRPVKAPLSIGHTDLIFYGEKLNEDGENVGQNTSSVLMGCPLQPRDFLHQFPVGCPLETIDTGSTDTHIPIVKTIEYRPDFSRSEGYVYSETLHLVKDKHTVIPYRTKIRSGEGRGMILSHLPSLNLSRHSLSGSSIKVCDPRPEIMAELLLYNQGFSSNINHPLKEWITEDLIPELQKSTVNTLSFTTDPIDQMIHNYLNQVYHTSSELSVQTVKEIAKIIIPERLTIPNYYQDPDPIIRSLSDFRRSMVNHDLNFTSLGSINYRTLDRIDYNPYGFQDICDIIDHIPLTDFNIDIVVNQQNEIVFFHEHVALDRLGGFTDSDTGLHLSEDIFRYYFCSDVIRDLLQKFLISHSNLTNEILEMIDYNSVKIKFIKTLSDEAAILLYNPNGDLNDAPLCGVYFDIAVQSLAPMSVMPEPIIN